MNKITFNNNQKTIYLMFFGLASSGCSNIIVNFVNMLIKHKPDRVKFHKLDSNSLEEHEEFLKSLNLSNQKYVSDIKCLRPISLQYEIDINEYVNIVLIHRNHFVYDQDFSRLLNCNESPLRDIRFCFVYDHTSQGSFAEPPIDDFDCQNIYLSRFLNEIEIFEKEYNRKYPKIMFVSKKDLLEKLTVGYYGSSAEGFAQHYFPQFTNKFLKNSEEENYTMFYSVCKPASVAKNELEHNNYKYAEELLDWITNKIKHL